MTTGPTRGSLVRATRAWTRSWSSLASIGIAAVLVVVLSWRTGGYFPAAYLEAGVLAYVAIVIVLVTAPPSFRLSTSALVGLGSLLCLAVWTGLSSGWSSTPNGALSEMQRALAYVGLLGLGVLAAGSGRFTRAFVWCVLAALMVVGVGALLSRLAPDLVPTPGFRPGGIYRLGYPLTYPNAVGAMTAMGAVLGIGLAGHHRGAPALRALAAAGAPALLVTMYLTLSRTAWLALVLAVLVLVALAGPRGPVLMSLALVGAGTVVLLVALSAYPALTQDARLGEGQAAEGHAYARVVALVLLAVGGLQLLVARRRWRVPVALPSLRRFALPTLLVTSVMAVGLFAAERRSMSLAVGSAERLLVAQWREFLRPTVAVPGGPERLKTIKTPRADTYRVALNQFRAHPLRGEGSGSFQVRWILERRLELGVRDAHSVYLETLGELGLVGAAMLFAFMGSVVAAVVRSRRRPGALGRSETAAVAGALAVWTVSAGLDWNWQMPALTGTALFLTATVYPYGQRTGRARSHRRDGSEKLNQT